jgi:hypothetical protein
MKAPKLFLLTALLAPGLALADGANFPAPPSGTPVGGVGPTTSMGDFNNIPNTCDANQLLAWLKGWRQHAREQYASDMARFIPPMDGASCIRNPKAFGSHYVPQGDHFIVNCYAQKGGKLSHVLQMDLTAIPDQSCMSDTNFTNYVKGTQCKMPGGNQAYLNQVLIPCRSHFAVPPQPTSTRFTPVDDPYWAKIQSDYPDIGDFVDLVTRRVKGSSSGSSPGSGGQRGGDTDGCGIFGTCESNGAQ